MPDAITISSEATPTVSVLMPVYNAERYVAEAVESILNQSFRDFEFLIVDDGSTDGSLAILEKYADADERIKLRSRENRGLVATLNEMLGEANGELLARMDADDVSLPERFAKQVEYLRENAGCVAVGSRATVIDPDGAHICEWFTILDSEELVSAMLSASKGYVFCHPSVMMRASPVKQLGGYRTEFYTAEDLDLFLRLAEVGSLANIPNVLLQYRMHSASICHTQKSTQNDAVRRIVVEALERRGLPVIAPEIAPLRGDEEKRLARKWAWWALNAGNIATARKYAWKTIRQAPLSRESWRIVYCALRGY